MTKRQEELLRPMVAAFVAGLDGRYREHASDRLLKALIMFRLGQASGGSMINQSRAELICEGEDHEVQNASYEAVCPIFERVLEDDCGVMSNGHHVAQGFARHMSEAVKAKAKGQCLCDTGCHGSCHTEDGCGCAKED